VSKYLIMDIIATYNKYIKLIPKIKKSQQSLRKLAEELNMSVNTLRKIKVAIQVVENQKRADKKTIRFTQNELLLIEEKAKEINMDFSAFVRYCISQQIY